MAQLPPKIPSMTHNWPSFPHQKMPIMTNFIPPSTAVTTTATTTMNHHPSWVEEFLDFSSARRGTHRRSASDSIAFLEQPLLVQEEECGNIIINSSVANGFDRLDDDQLMSMFSDDVSLTVPPTASSSNPSTLSDQNSNNDNNKAAPLDHLQQPKHEPGEVESSCQVSDPSQPLSTSTVDPITDPKRVKRILANRQSAQRSRVRKLQYISELERSVTSLQTEVSALSPRVAFLDHQRLILNVDNSALKQRIAALTQDRIFKDAHQEALKKEIERLRQVYHRQNLKKMDSTAANNNAPPPPRPSPPQHATATPPPQQRPQQRPQQPPNTDTVGCTDN